MIIKIAPKAECLKIGKEQLKKDGYLEEQISLLSEDFILDFIPEELFDTEHLCCNYVDDETGRVYYVGQENWAVADFFVEEIIAE